MTVTSSVCKPRLFSWYLTKFVATEVLVSFLLGTSIFLFIMLMFQAIRLSEFVVVHQVAPWDVGRLSLFLMLSFLPIAVPIAFLFAVLMGISRANSEGEILALQVSGISIGQIYLPLGVFSILLSLFCLYLAMYFVPRGNRAFELLITKLGSERAIADLKPGVFLEGFHGLVLFVEHIVPSKNEMKRVFIYDERDEEHPLAISAQAGILRPTPDKSILTLRLTHGSIYVDNRQHIPKQQRIDFDVYDINLDIPVVGDSWRDYSPPSYNYPRLMKRIDETRHDPPAHRQLLVELHRRFSLSFTCIVFSALGFFIGVISQRGIRSTAVLLCLVVGLIYWLSYIAANALALAGWVLPWLGIWIPNLFFGAIAVGLYLRRS